MSPINPFQKAQSLTGDITRSSALSSLLVLCLEISVPSFAAAFYLKEGLLTYFFMMIGLIPVVYTIKAFLYFMTTNPDALRSEKYNIEIRKMELLGSKDKPLENYEEATKNPSMIEGPK